ncbi:MAG TPA: hypothetical protein VGU45_02080 [Microvirga sp.]|jgi:hypothetical protein|nr:hypothetical protein [Microvirga sp.]
MPDRSYFTVPAEDDKSKFDIWLDINDGEVKRRLAGIQFADDKIAELTAQALNEAYEAGKADAGEAYREA